MHRSKAVFALLVLLLSACQGRQSPTLAIAGGSGGGLPRATAEAEHFDPAALDELRAQARRDGLGGLLVSRHNHLVLEYYGAGWAAADLHDAGPLAELLVVMAAGVAVGEDHLGTPDLHAFNARALADAIATAGHQPYEDYLSQRVWQRLQAAPARFLLGHAGERPEPDCCFAARLSDWLRVGGALIDDGRYEGTQVLPRGWVARLRLPRIGDPQHGFGVLLADAARGREALGARDAFFVRGEGAWRLWMVPSLQLVILSAGASAPADETILPNAVIRAINGPGTGLSGAPQLKDLVPGH